MPNLFEHFRGAAYLHTAKQGKGSVSQEKKQVSTSEDNGKADFSIIERRRGMKASDATPMRDEHRLPLAPTGGERCLRRRKL